MKQLFTGLFVTFSLALVAQSDFVRSDLWRVGDSFSYLGLDATNVEPGSSGTNVTWDFSQVPLDSARVYTMRYELPSGGLNADLFPEATSVGIRTDIGSPTYSYYKDTDQEIRHEGLADSFYGYNTYTDKCIELSFPLSYNQTQSDTFIGSHFYDEVNGEPVVGSRTGSCTITYDGYGTILLPDGTIETNVRRTHEFYVLVSEISVPMYYSRHETHWHHYYYWKEGERAPIFRWTSVDSDVATPEISNKYAWYRRTVQPVDLARGTHLTTQGGDFDSEILIRNPSSIRQALILQPYSISGEALAPVITCFGPGETRAPQESYFSPSATSFSTSGCPECVFSVGYRAKLAGSSTAQVHQKTRTSTEYFFYPGEWDLLSDGSAIVNAGDAAAKVEVFQYNDNGELLASAVLVESLAPGAKQLSIFNNVLQNTPNTLVKLVSTQPISVLILRISQDNRFLYQNLPLPAPSAADESRWIAHVTSETGGFDTDIFIHNSSPASKTVTLHPFSANGSALATVEVTVAANNTKRYSKTGLVSADTSHMSISGDRDCLVTVGYRARVDGSSTAPIHEVTPVTDKFYLYPAEWDILYDGVSLINTGNGNAQITVRQLSDTGAILNTAIVAEALIPNGKFLGTLNALFSENSASVIEVESTQPLAVLALRLSQDGRYLYANELIPQ